MRRLLAACSAVTVLAAVPALGHTGSPASMHMEMVGNMQPYPDLEAAGTANVRRARRLLRASRATAARFDTLAEARRLGYRIRRFIRPGFTHLRKNGVRPWGRMLDPRAPQSLVFWCPASGRCTLTTYMYRAPGGPPPDTWGDLLQWHRHATTHRASWSTHVWLVRRVREGYATCAPWDALREAYGLVAPPHYRAIMVDKPCPAGADDPMPG